MPSRSRPFSAVSDSQLIVFAVLAALAALWLATPRFAQGVAGGSSEQGADSDATAALLDTGSAE